VLVADKEESQDGAFLQRLSRRCRSCVETQTVVRKRSQCDCWVFLIVRDTKAQTSYSKGLAEMHHEVWDWIETHAEDEWRWHFNERVYTFDFYRNSSFNGTENVLMCMVVVGRVRCDDSSHPPKSIKLPRLP